jgi:hypothetical protein
MADQNIPNQASNMEQAEGSRETVDATLDQQEGSAGGDQAGGGITNRPLDEEIENQRDLPPRGKAKNPGEQSNAGRSDEPLLTPDDLNATPPHGDVTPPHER